MANNKVFLLAGSSSFTFIVSAGGGKSSILSCSDVVCRVAQNEGHKFPLYISHSCSSSQELEGGETGESADVFSAFVSPHKLINILSFSLSRRPHPEHEDNNIKNYCLTFMCHLANIFSFFVAWLFSRFAFLRWVHSPKDRLKRASKELFYCFTFLSALMSFYCQSFACRNILHFVARRQSFALFLFLTHFSPPEAGAANSFRKRISACKSWESR